ncbi:MAG TPA: M56 family metallopeptidase, partial [Terracidiphilus sp.]
NSLWQVPLLFAAGLLAARALRSSGPEAEHRVWVGVLLLESMLPACSNANFAWLRTLLQWNAGSRASGDGLVTIVMNRGTAAGTFSVPSIALTVIAIAYGAMALYFAARFAWRWSQLNSIRGVSIPIPLAGETARCWAQYSELFGVRNASLASSSRVFAPVTLGIAPKILLLPTGIIARISEADMQTVIAHEFAHMRRNDFLKNLIYELLSLPVCYHPMHRLTRERITESREIVCDRLAADLTGRSKYSRSLLRLASLLVGAMPTRAAHAVGIFDTNTLERRLMKLAEKQSEIRGMRRFAALAACLALGAATCASALVLHMQVNSAGASSHHPTMHPSSLNVSPKTMEGNIITKVQPKYPAEAKEKRIQGKVVLNAVIDKEGNVAELKVDSGPKELRQSALDAVRQWKYKPYILNGQPVAVKTTININYTLSK